MTTKTPSSTSIPAAPSSMRTLAPGEYDFFKVVQGYLDAAAKVINLAPHVATILSQPKNEIIVNFPVKGCVPRRDGLASPATPGALWSNTSRKA